MGVWKLEKLANGEETCYIPNGRKRGLPLKVVHNLATDFPEFLIHLTFN